MVSSTQLTVKISDRLLRWRWPVAVCVALIVVGFEIIEHLFAQQALDSNFAREVLLFGVLAPLGIGAALTLLAHTRAELFHSFYRLDRQHALSQAVAQSHSWDELSKTLVQFPRTVAPLAGASLFVYDQVRHRFELSTEWWDVHRQPSPDARRFLEHDFCPMCTQAPTLCALSSQHCAGAARIPRPYHRFSLPLTHAGQPVAVLFLYLPAGLSLDRQQLDVFSSIAPMMALAIDNARPQRSALIRAEAAQTERQRIAPANCTTR